MTVVERRPLLAGIFVGGGGTRMGGIKKGLMPAPQGGEAIAARLCRICREALPSSQIVLVGDASAYAELGLESIADDPSGVGPLGGLRALLAHARASGRQALALATDLPYVSPELVRRLGEHAASAAAVAPRMSGFWQPLFARYASDVCLEVVDGVLSRGRRALHDVLTALGERAAVLPLDPAEESLLRDWDTPDDVRG